MLSNLSGLEGALIGLAIAVIFIVRQFSTRRVASAWMVIVPIALVYFGAGGLTQLDRLMLHKTRSGLVSMIAARWRSLAGLARS